MIDLHVHTTESDGKFTPSQIINMAKDIGIDILAITDHDNIDGLEEGIKKSQELGIRFIPGIEMSSYYKSDVHILGYSIDLDNVEFNAFLKQLIINRNERNKKYVDLLNSIGINIKLEDVDKKLNGKVGKPHFADWLVENGYANDKEDAFEKFFRKGPLKDIKREHYDPKEVIGLILRANGIPVLAHPKLIGFTYAELDKFVGELVSYGLKGIEVRHSEHSKEDVIEFSRIAEKYNLIKTCGSDFHDQESNVELGRGKDGNLIVEDEEYYASVENLFRK